MDGLGDHARGTIVGFRLDLGSLPSLGGPASCSACAGEHSCVEKVGDLARRGLVPDDDDDDDDSSG
jgi:hypothetical protein